MASVPRCRLSFPYLQQSTRLLRRKTKSLVAATATHGTRLALLTAGCEIRTVCGGAAVHNSTTSLVQAMTRSHQFRISRNFQKFPPILACNVGSVTVTENLIDLGEIEECSEGEDEATSGRKRIRSPIILNDDP